MKKKVGAVENSDIDTKEVTSSTASDETKEKVLNTKPALTKSQQIAANVAIKKTSEKESARERLLEVEKEMTATRKGMKTISKKLTEKNNELKDLQDQLNNGKKSAREKETLKSKIAILTNDISNYRTSYSTHNDKLKNLGEEQAKLRQNGGLDRTVEERYEAMQENARKNDASKYGGKYSKSHDSYTLIDSFFDSLYITPNQTQDFFEMIG